MTAYEDEEYCKIQNGGIMAIPDGGPLSSVGRKRGYSGMKRTTGSSLMGEIFKISAEKGYRHLYKKSVKKKFDWFIQDHLEMISNPKCFFAKKGRRDKHAS